MRKLVAIGVVVGSAWVASTIPAQVPGALPTFEVASIRPPDFPGRGGPGGTKGGGGGRGGPGPNRIDAQRMDLPFVALGDLLSYAFRVKDYQIAAPSWVRQSRWSISAKLPDGSSQDQAPDMMQALLIERFKLAVHREKREQPVYTLAVANGGLKVQKASPGEYPAWDGSFPGFGFRRPLQSGAPITGRIVPAANCTRHYEFVPLPMAAFADALTLFLGKPVVDETGVEGDYRVILELTGEAEAGVMMNIIRPEGLPLPSAGGGGGRGGPGGGDLTPPPPPPPGPPPNDVSPGCPNPITLLGDVVGTPDAAIVKALQPLGLRLQTGRAPIDTIVVDHLEKTPTEN
jgi:uncharacterized protein (TIGR03435 family)